MKINNIRDIRQFLDNFVVCDTENPFLKLRCLTLRNDVLLIGYFHGIHETSFPYEYPDKIGYNLNVLLGVNDVPGSCLIDQKFLDKYGLFIRKLTINELERIRFLYEEGKIKLCYDHEGKKMNKLLQWNSCL